MKKLNEMVKSHNEILNDYTEKNRVTFFPVNDIERATLDKYQNMVKRFRDEENTLYQQNGGLSGMFAEFTR